MKQQFGNFEDSFAIHQRYIDILNCVPSIVYWIDNHCILKGCNYHFVELLGLKSPRDLTGTPYELIKKFTTCSQERIETLKLDDMKVIFAGEPQIDVEEAPIYDRDKKEILFLSRRIPLFDNDKQVIGLVVVLTDITEYKKDQLKLNELTQKNQVATKTTPKIKSYKKNIAPKILMIEDNEIAQKIEESLLTALNCEVDVAESGAKAIQLFSPGKYDLVFMDIGLEDTSGYLVAKKIRQLEGKTKHRVPIIALTSYQADIVKPDCEYYLMDGVLSKPLTSEQAEQLIKYYVNHEDTPIRGLQKVNTNNKK